MRCRMPEPRVQKATNPKCLLSLICTGVLITTAGCSHKSVPLPLTASIPSPDRSYMDLEPGWKLRILVPLLKSGGLPATGASQQMDGNTISLSAENLIGYEVSYYSVAGKPSGAVRLRFTSAAITTNGKTVVEPNPPALPFHLPRSTGHIRLVYLVRASQADHGMAIVSSKHIDALNAFTKQLKERPSICNESNKIFCSWVPSGVAVRPERE